MKAWKPVLFAMSMMIPGPVLAGALAGPISDVGLRVEIEDVVQLPASSLAPPFARVNFLREAPDESGRLFANDLRGQLHVIDRNSSRVYLDLSSEVPLKTAPNIGTGFGSFSFHPEFASSGVFYTIHTEAVRGTPANFEPAIDTAINQHSIVTEWKATDPTADVFDGTHRELIRVAAISTNHNLGEVAFDYTARPGDADYGLLYISAGDYGSVALGQPEQLQRLDSIYGSIMRIDPLGTPFERDGVVYDYAIPPSNPFTDVPGALGEIYANGFRNAHRLAWDRRGTLIVSDIGQANIEEVNIVDAGDNHGWPVREGTFALDVEINPNIVLPLPAIDPLPFQYPAAQYDHEEGRAIAGGFVYLGKEIPELLGQFVFGDLTNGRIFYTRASALRDADKAGAMTTADIFELRLLRDGALTNLILLARAATGRDNLFRADLRFGLDAEGELYVTTKQDGFVRRLVRDARPDCADGFDDDGDEKVDYPADPGCFDALSDDESPQCQDGRNNDRRRGTDFDGGVSVLGEGNGDPHGADPQCEGDAWRDREAKKRKSKKRSKKKKSGK